MQLTERHVIDRADPRFAVIDQAACKPKNLYNAALYLIRQAFIFEGKSSENTPDRRGENGKKGTRKKRMHADA